MKYFLFDKAQKYVTRINTEYLIEAHYTEEINTAGQLEFTLPATMRLPKNVFYVCVTDPNDETSYLMFKIVTEKVTDEQVTYTCIENAYDELASYNYIKDKRPTAIASAMLQMVLDGTRWSVGSCPEVSPKFCSFYYISVLEAIQKIVNLWGFEVQFQVKIDGITNEIKQRNVNMYAKLGERTNKRFEYGSNLLSVTQANDSTGLYTALVGRGKGVQVSEGDTDTDPDGYGRRITFADVVWSTQNGNPLNKPAGQEYLEDPNATAAYGFPDGHPRIGFVVFQDCEDPNELIQLTYNKLQEVNHPQVQFSANIADVGSLNLGDTIAIIRHDIGIEYYTRVFKVVHDLLDSSNNTVELGDNIAGSNSITQQISTIKDNQSNVQNAIDTIVMNGADGNKLFFGTDFPANGTDGDIFYKTLENGGTEMYIYKDGGWQLVVSTEELDAVQKKVDEQTSQIQQAVDSANSAVSKADEAVASIGDAETMAKNAQATANQNKQDIATVQGNIESTKSDLQSNVQELQGNIESTKSDLQSTVQELQGVSNDLNTVKQQAISQGQSIIDIQRSTIALGTKMADVQGNVSSLQQTTRSLQSSVQDNANNISSVKQTATQLSSTISNLQNAGENLIINSTFSQGSYHWNVNDHQISPDVLFMNSKGVSITQSGLTSPNWKDISATDKIPVSQGQTISVGCWIKTSGVDISGDGNRGAAIGVNWYADKNSPRNHFNDFYDTKAFGNHDWLYIKMENVKVPTDSNFVKFHMFLTQNGTAQFVLPLMVFGGTLPSWSPSPLDSATVTDMSSVKQTVSSLQSTVQSNTGDISILKQTATQLQSSIKDNANNISSIKQTAGSIQSTVASMQNAGDNLIVNSDFEQGGYHWNLNGWQISNDDEFRNHKIISKTQNGLGSANYNAFSATDLIPVQKGQTISIGVWVKASNIDSSGEGNKGAAFGVNWYADNHSGRNHWTDFWDRTYYGNHDWQFLKMEGLQPPSDSHFVRAHFFLTQNGSAQFALPIMVYGDTLPAWSPSPLDSATAIDMSSVKQTVSSLQSTVQSNTGDISTLKQTATELQSNIKDNADNISAIKQTADSVQSTVANMKVGGTNLLPETENYTGYIKWGNVEYLPTYSYNDYSFTPQTKIIHLWTSNNNPIDNASPTPDNKSVNLIQGNVYTFSAYVWHYGGNDKTNELITLHANNGNSSVKLGTVTTTLTGTATKYKVTFTAPQTGEYTRFRVVHWNDSVMTNGSMYIAEMKLEDGNVATDWSPSPYDLASQTDMSSVQQKVDSITSTVQSQSGDISQLKQTASSLQSNIKSKADISQITQLSNVIQSEVQSIGPVLLNGTFDDNNFKTYYIPWDITKDYSHISINSHNHWLDIFGSNNDDVKYMYKYYMPVIPGTTFRYSGSSKLDWGGGRVEPEADMYIHFYDANKNEIIKFFGYYRYDNNNQWYDFSVSCTVPDNAAYARIESRLQVRGCSRKTWLSLDNLKVSGGVDTVSSKISQMSDDINLRVQKGDLLSQINIEAGQTLIQSDKLYLDASSVVFSGNAFIPSAAITDLSADKITTGTLNAANVHVINMDVANLVGNTTSFVRSQWQNAYGSYVNIESSGMSVGYGNWFTKFDSLGMTFKEGGDDLGGFTRIGMQNAPSWYGGLAFYAGGDTEFLSIGAKDYHNDNQNLLPSKLLWMRQDIDTHGYNAGWNVLDDIWMDKVGMNSIQYGSWNIHFGIVVGSNNFSALTLTSGRGNGFYWGSDGSFGYVTGETTLHNVRGTQIVHSIGSDGTCQSWTTI